MFFGCDFYNLPTDSNQELFIELENKIENYLFVSKESILKIYTIPSAFKVYKKMIEEVGDVLFMIDLIIERGLLKKEDI